MGLFRRNSDKSEKSNNLKVNNSQSFTSINSKEDVRTASSPTTAPIKQPLSVATLHPNGSTSTTTSSSSSKEQQEGVYTLEQVPELITELHQYMTKQDQQQQQQQIPVITPTSTNNEEKNKTDKKSASKTRSTAQILRILYHVSAKHRVEIVRSNPILVPILLNFLKKYCQQGSNEQYLSLLVLNHISIPAENKRTIALEHNGARILSHLLCDDPSCHLIAIILVNLTFSDSNLRHDLVDPKYDVQIIESLAYALRLSSLTQEEYRGRPPLEVGDENGLYSPKDLLQAMMDGDNKAGRGTPTVSNAKDEPDLKDTATDASQTSNNQETDNKDNKTMIKTRHVHDNDHDLHQRMSWKDPSHYLYPETAKWCLSALRNLCRPSLMDNTMACQTLIKSNICPLILRYITLLNEPTIVIAAQTTTTTRKKNNNNNCPGRWDSNSLEDAALYLVLYLAALGSTKTREALVDMGTVDILSRIVEYSLEGTATPTPSIIEVSKVTNDEADEQQHAHLPNDVSDIAGNEEEHHEAASRSSILELQCLKARMGLAFLVASTGHFGQPRTRQSLTTVYASTSDDSVILLSEAETSILIDLLGHALSNRGKSGPGGYSVGTFPIKEVLMAIRCFLTHTLNQLIFVNVGGPRLNALLVKVLAEHAMLQNPAIDAQAAEYAAFSLYLLSNYGFKTRFLPLMYGESDEGYPIAGCIMSKLLTHYTTKVESITPAAHHAADQLLLRLKYLYFKGNLTDAQSVQTTLSPQDLALSHAAHQAIHSVVLEKRIHGAKPLNDIFDRPVLRSRAPKRGNTQRAPWDNRASVRVYASVLHAVQELSFGSTKVRHMDAIDDVLIANNIAAGANGDKTETYHYWWSWEDSAGEIQKNLERQRSNDSASIFSGGSATKTHNINNNNNNNTAVARGEAEPPSFLGFTWGAICGMDTTVPATKGDMVATTKAA